MVYYINGAPLNGAPFNGARYIMVCILRGAAGQVEPGAEERQELRQVLAEDRDLLEPQGLPQQAVEPHAQGAGNE